MSFIVSPFATLAPYTALFLRKQHMSVAALSGYGADTKKAPISRGIEFRDRGWGPIGS
jgi:hypothetical protein